MGKRCLRRAAALLCAALLACAASAQETALHWSAADDQPATALSLASWQCTRMVDNAAGLSLAACRRTGGAASVQLRLLQIQTDGDKPPRVHELARLGDASTARLRWFAPARSCRQEKAAAPCLEAIVLVDQRDESSCYGTQVWVALAGKPLRSIGFIDELRVDAGSEVCVGPVATVIGVPGGAKIELPGPLLRAGRDGTARPLSAAQVEYRIAAARPALRRKAIEP